MELGRGPGRPARSHRRSRHKPQLRTRGDVRPGESPRDGRWGPADEDCRGDRPQWQPSPTWRAVESMAVARRHLNATLLPDGTVLVTGGTSKSRFNTPDDTTSLVHNPEIWNPATERWNTTPPNATTLARGSGIPRIYHSSALLLPDARVLSMGGNDQMTSEIYSPPYLFNSGTARPTITSAPEIVAYGQTFFVGTPDPAAISTSGKVTMLRLSSVTHTFNMSQYIIEFQRPPASGPLSFSQPQAPAASTLWLPPQPLLRLL